MAQRKFGGEGACGTGPGGDSSQSTESRPSSHPANRKQAENGMDPEVPKGRPNRSRAAGTVAGTRLRENLVPRVFEEDSPVPEIDQDSGESFNPSIPSKKKIVRLDSKSRARQRRLRGGYKQQEEGPVPRPTSQATGHLSPESEPQQENLGGEGRTHNRKDRRN